MNTQNRKEITFGWASLAVINGEVEFCEDNGSTVFIAAVQLVNPLANGDRIVVTIDKTVWDSAGCPRLHVSHIKRLR